MIDRPYNNSSSQRERRAALENERRVRDGATFHQIARSEFDATIGGGRFAVINKTAVTGSEPVRYPEQPQNAPWADRLPDEPPLGYSVDEQPVVGEVFEVEKSLAEAHDGVGSPRPDAVVQPSPSGDAQRLGAGAPSSADVAPSPPSHKRKRARHAKA